MSLLARFRLQGGSSTSTGANEGPSGSRGRPSSPSPSRRSLFRPHSRSVSPSLDRFSQTPPPNQGDRRRQRSDSMEDVERQRTLKRQKRYALHVCSEYQLPDNELDLFAELDTPQMLIRIYGKLLSIERARQKDENHAFIRSEEFKEILKDRLRSCLLSPHLTCYLDGLPEHIWPFMKANLMVFKIPAKVLEDVGIPDYIDSLMKDILTKLRAMIKNKIALSIKSKQHISLLAKALAQSGYYEVTASQWARFAFLRKSLVAFNELVMETMARTVEATMGTGQSGDNSTDESNNGECNGTSNDETAPQDWVQADFWEYIDQLLGDVRAEAAQDGATLDEQKAILEKFFTECLQDDLQKYRAMKRNCPVPQAANQVLSDWQRAIHQELVWS